MSNEPSRAYITTKILQRRYGRLLKWKKPVIHDIRGPYHPDVFDGFAFDLALSIKVCKETLQDMTDAEFFDRFDLRGEVSNPANTMAERLTLSELRAVFRQEPVWFAGGFGVEGREADVQHWARMQRWSLNEAAALSIGFEPCGDLLEGTDGMPVQSDVLAFYFKRRALIEDNFDWGNVADSCRNSVPDVVRWFDQVKLDVPEQLLAAADKYHALEIGKKLRLGRASTADDKHVDPRERSTMLKLIITMAVRGYGYDPKAERSTIPSEIESDMNLLGIGITLETVRKHLKSGSALLCDEVLEDIGTSGRIKKD
ncbi:MAG: hypothetical protein KBT70_12170 [Roseovarius sp.]|uniref:hypothetical protein n=1 Tax=Roseovarius sp. TaxID=1486281 RepID=UPI001B708712|nr:hypothetical protein [Roseovarius sp.]MBQ0750947.1 hypothetical protein [Roseovarius sp.]MBQ0810272.1 hypothetical protein [Roseovarius sp.]